ncbi:MAG TPA: hypothetical protein VHC69_02630 [Polyangiaceae bacterium]|nr:hypothetical protein [Polyangiaceae bacterium]
MRSEPILSVLGALVLVPLGLPLPLDAPATNTRTALEGQQLEAPACDEWIADFALAARLRLADTPFGAGNGSHDIGPGRLRLRMSKTLDPAAAKVELVAYEMHEQFVIKAAVLFMHATITTVSDTRATPDVNGVIATGMLHGREITWLTPVRGYRTDGTMQCEGSGCGFSGVPSSGTTPLHVAPHPVQFAPFVFDPAFETLQMSESKVAQTEKPKQTAYLALSGRRSTLQCQ